MQIKIIAVGSTKWERFIRRWGVSFLIGEDVLFDTFGDPGILLNNIRKFKVDIAKIKHIVLSHDDWDHISGLWYLLPKCINITVYVCPGFNHEVKDRIASFGVKYIEVKGITQIKDNIYSTGELLGESEGRNIYEQSVVIKAGDGLVLICGCAHPGVVNIIRYVKDRFQKNIYSLIGGFHLKNNATEINMNIVRNLRDIGIRKVAPMHCTGKHATGAMREMFGHNFIRVREGSIVEL